MKMTLFCMLFMTVFLYDDNQDIFE